MSRGQDRKKRKPRVTPKRAISESLDRSSIEPIGLQERTGQEQGFPNIGEWQRKYPATDDRGINDENNGSERRMDHPGKTWPDVVWALFYEGNIEVLTFVAIGFLVLMFVWQDNGAGKLDSFDGVLHTFRNIGFVTFALLLLSAVLRLLLRKRRA